MIESVHWSLRVDVPCSGEVADQLFFLGVEADYRLCIGQILRFEFCNFFKTGRCDRDAPPIDFFLRAVCWPMPLFLSSLRTT